MKKLFLIVFLAMLCCAWGQEVDFTRMTLKVELDTMAGEVQGEVDLDFVYEGPVDSIFLNGVNMDFKGVQLNNGYVPYSYNEKGVWIKPDTTDLDSGDVNTISITYTAKPRKGIYFIGWKDTTGLSRRQIWTQGQGIDHRHWIPHRDDQTDKLITDITVIFDSDYNVISNGHLAERKRHSFTEDSWRYVMDRPMSSYLIAVAIGDYDSTQTYSDNNIPLVQYYYPERASDYDHYYYKNEEIHNFLQEEIGVIFPWQNYKQVPVQDFRHGAMENTTATIFGDFFLVDAVAFNDRNYTHVNAHELAHQWFGNLVTAESSNDHWLHEGFATYYQWLSEKNLYGQQHYDWERYKAAEQIAQANKTNKVALGDAEAGSARFYQKGAWVLHMLSEQMGREDYRKAIQHYLEEYRYGIVTTDSLAASIRAVTDYDPQAFLDQWVRNPSEPVIFVDQMGVTSDTALYLQVRQDTEVSIVPFAIDAKVDLVYEGDVREQKALELRKDEEEFRLPLKKDTVLKYWNFDPGMNILGPVGETKSEEMYLEQLRDTLRLLDRYEALLHMENVAFEEKKEILDEIVKDEELHHALRAEALRQIMDNGLMEHRDYLFAALRGHDVELQKEALQYVEDNPEGEMRDVLASLRKGRSYQLRALAIHASINNLNGEKNEWLYDEMYEMQPGIPGREVHITALLYRVALFKDATAFKQLVKYTSEGYDFQTRINAMQAVKAFDLVTEDLIGNLFSAFFNANWKLRKEAREILQGFYRGKEGRKLVNGYISENERHWDAGQRRSVSRTFDGNTD